MVREVHGGSEMFVFVLLAEFLCVGVHSFKEHLGNAFQQMEVLTGAPASKTRPICFCSLLF